MEPVKFTTSKEAIINWIDDTNSQRQIQARTFVSWIGRCMERLRTVYTLVKKDGEVTIKDYRGLLPCELVQIDQVVTDGRALTSVINTHTVDKANTDSTSRSVAFPSAYTYSIQWPYIHPYFAEGTLRIYYWAMPVDNEGFPLIPDNEFYKEAIVRYFTMKLKYAQAVAGIIQFAEYFKWEQHFNHMADKAEADIFMPGPDQWQAIADQFMRLIPNPASHAEMFKDASGIHVLD